MTSFYKDPQISLSVLTGKTVAILGYGNQGKPHALNLKDSGVTVVVGLRDSSKKYNEVSADGLIPMPIKEAVEKADVIMMLLPDEVMAPVYTPSVAPYLKPGAYLGFCHGMAIHANLITPRADINVFLLAPKAQGRGVRSRYLEGLGVPALVAVHQDVSGDTLAIALAYGRAIGCGRAGILPTTFAEETISNHFSEQAVLCGGLSKLIQTAFEVQIEAGISPEVAYFGCLHEVKLLADLIYEGSITSMRKKISPTARYGDLTRGEKVIDAHVKESMRQVLQEVTTPQFVEEFLADVAAGSVLMQEKLTQESYHPIETVGAFLREHYII